MQSNNLTRSEKVEKIYDASISVPYSLMYMTDQKINELYEEHFNQVTEEDFEVFEKVWEKCSELIIEKISRQDPITKEEIKKELGL